MEPTTHESNTARQKFIVAFVMLAAIVIVALGVTFFKDKDTGASASGTPAAATYKDGSYSASGTYTSPGGNETIDVSLTIQGGIVAATSVSQNADNRESAEYQSRFKQNYSSRVVGKSLSGISLSRVSGSSLTSQGFNEALQAIKSQAQN